MPMQALSMERVLVESERAGRVHPAVLRLGLAYADGSRHGGERALRGAAEHAAHRCCRRVATSSAQDAGHALSRGCPRARETHGFGCLTLDLDRHEHWIQ